MKRTIELENYCINIIRRTENFLGYKKHKVIFENPTKRKRIFGSHSCRLGIIFINIEFLKTIRRLSMTCVHEVCHCEIKRHSKKFYLKVIETSNCLFDGKDFEKYNYDDRFKY